VFFSCERRIKLFLKKQFLYKRLFISSSKLRKKDA